MEFRGIVEKSKNGRGRMERPADSTARKGKSTYTQTDTSETHACVHISEAWSACETQQQKEGTKYIVKQTQRTETNSGRPHLKQQNGTIAKDVQAKV